MTNYSMLSTAIILCFSIIKVKILRRHIVVFVASKIQMMLLVLILTNEMQTTLLVFVSRRVVETKVFQFLQNLVLHLCWVIFVAHSRIDGIPACKKTRIFEDDKVIIAINS